MAVPYTFGTATSSIPLSQLDSNFNTVITLGNTAIQLGNTVTTLNNMTLANVTISSGNITLTNVSATTANVTTANITTAVIGTETVTTSTITTANVTTANITTANITTGTVITSLTLSYGTANGVAYLNGSKVLTTGSAFVFDGTNVGVGTSSPAFPLDVGGTLANIRVAPSTATNNALTRYVNTGGTGYVGLDGSAGGLTAAYALNLYHTGAYPIVFSTSGTERMRIDSSGNLLVGATSAGGAGGVTIYPLGGGAGSCATQVFNKSNTTSDSAIQFRVGGSTVSGISYTSTLVTYGTVSDYRAKNVIGSVIGSGERIDALEPIEYEWKIDGSRTHGFLAHKFQEVYPNSVTGTKDAVDEEGKPVYQSMQAGSAEVIADLVAEIQSLRKRLAALESR